MNTRTLVIDADWTIVITEMWTSPDRIELRYQGDPVMTNWLDKQTDDELITWGRNWIDTMELDEGRNDNR